MMRVLHGSLAALLGALCALAVGCGDDNLLSGSDADALKGSLADLRTAVEDGDCSGVDEQVAALQSDLKQIPGTVDRRLRQRLREEIADTLVPQARSECTASTTQETQTETTEPTTTETVPPETTTTETVPPPTTTEEVPTDTVPTDEVPPPTEPAPTPDPGEDDDTGGFGPENGFSAGGAG